MTHYCGVAQVLWPFPKPRSRIIREEWGAEVSETCFSFFTSNPISFCIQTKVPETVNTYGARTGAISGARTGAKVFRYCFNT